MEITKLGSLYFDETPVKVGSDWNGKPIMIGDTVKTKPLSWVKVGNLLVADHTICTSTSWEDLDQAGFIFGQPVQIDGVAYLCRSLKVGDQDRGVPNEWDTFLDQTGENDSLWHWKGTSFWGQETPKGCAAYRARRGYHSVRYWYLDLASSRRVHVGFRPVLEELISDTLISDSLIGSSLKVYGPNGMAVSGKLLEFSEYDLILQSKEQAPGVWCSSLQEGVMAVDRSAILYTSLA